MRSPKSVATSAALLTNAPFSSTKGSTMKTLIAAAVCAAVLAGCAAAQSRETAGQYLGDTAITSKVKAELLAKEGTGASEISVQTMQGDVQLAGFARNAGDKQRAGEIARAVSGVKQVHNDILVR
jgi:hyperosmotically inducible periplasmic protein